MNKKKIFGENKYVYEVEGDYLYLSEDKQNILIVKVPEEFEDIDDYKESDILDLEIFDDESEWFIIIDRMSLSHYKQMIERILNKLKETQ